MIFLRLFFEFFKTGLFSIGGGLATIPFLQDMGEATGWFTNQELTTMIAVSESTPGPMGVNMATYVGYHMGCNTVLGPAGGILGAVIATLGLVAPSIIVILIIARFLQKVRHSRTVEAAFQGLRPASTALIVVAGLTVEEVKRMPSEAAFWQALGTTRQENLAQGEHLHWNATLFANEWDTWHPAPGSPSNKDEQRKLHACLVDWDELEAVEKQFDEPYRQYDYDSIRNIYALVRNNLYR